MKIQLSMSTGSFYPSTTAYSIDRIHKLGLKSVEIAIQSSEIGYDFFRQIQSARFDRLMRTIQTRDLSVCSLHAPFLSGVEAFSSRARIEILLKTLEIARRLGGSELIVHPYHIFATYESLLSFLSSEALDPQAHLLSGFQSFLRNADDCGIKVAIENISHWNDHPLLNDPRNLSRIVRGLSDESIRADLDIFHSEYARNTNAFLHTLSKHIMSIHASDISETGGRTLPGIGRANWKEISQIAKTLPELKHIVLEVRREFSDDEIGKSIAYLDDVLLNPLQSH